MPEKENHKEAGAESQDVPSTAAIEEVIRLVQDPGISQSAKAIIEVTGSPAPETYLTIVRDQLKNRR